MQPDIYLGDLRIAEPVTTLTAWLITLVGLYAWRRLRYTMPAGRFQYHLRLFFLFMALSTFFGGLLGHAFLYALSFEWKLPGWTLGMVSIAFLERAVIAHASPELKPAWVRFLYNANIVELVVFIGLTVWTLNFHVVEIQAAFGLLVIVTGFETFLYTRRRQPGSVWILLSIPVVALGVVAQVAKFSISPWFTFFDLAHVLMCVSLYMIMRGGETSHNLS